MMDETPSPNEPNRRADEPLAPIDPVTNHAVAPAVDGAGRITRYERWSLIVAFLALAISLAVGFLSIYLPYFHEHRELTARVFAFQYDYQLEQLSTELILSNGGNRYEVVVGAYFELPHRGEISGSFWPHRDFPRKRLAPVILAPGESAHRRVVQVISAEAFGKMKRANKTADLGDPDWQRVAIGITAQDLAGKPRHDVIDLVEFAVNDVGRWRGVESAFADSTDSFLRTVNLLEAGRIDDSGGLLWMEMIGGTE